MTPTDEALTEAQRVLEAAASAGLTLRATGGIAVALTSPSALSPPLRRDYRDLDFVTSSRNAHDVADLFRSLGYEPEEEFNLFHGKHRLFFHHQKSGYEADIFLDKIEMCHTLDLRRRLESHATTLSLADLLLSKLQVLQTNEKDFKDILALLADHPVGNDPGEIHLDRIDELCTTDWGWWKSVTLVIARTQDQATEIIAKGGPSAEGATQAVGRLQELNEHLERVPKSRRWKLRAQVGERVRWHEEPEDIDHVVPGTSHG